MALRIGIAVVFVVLLLVFASMSMAWLIGFVLVVMAASSIFLVLYMVLREQHGEKEEWYDPSAPENQPKPEKSGE